MNAPDAPNARYRDLARWLLEQELGSREGGLTPAEAAGCVGREFYRRLAPLITAAGGQAFLSRALYLTCTEFPFLRGLRAGPSPDACFEGLDVALNDVEVEMALDAFVTVFAHMIRLLATFIGEDLTMHAIREAWPEARLPDREVQSQ